MELESLILEKSELGKISDSIKDCLRCGKCKPVCSTHVPRANLLYSPRNKILGASLLIEAFLYEEQTRRGVSLEHFSEFGDVADHCTVCHKCLTPCPVDIDFGDVSVAMRNFLRKQGKQKFNLSKAVAMAFLNASDATTIKLVRKVMIESLVVANILAPVIVRLFGNGLAGLIEGQGVLILSGILEDQAGRVLVAGQAQGLVLKEKRQIGDWVALAMSPAKE